MKTKAILAILLAVTLAIALCACAKRGAEEKSLREHGMDVIAMMDEMLRSDAYAAAMSASDQIRTQTALLSEGDYTAPKAVYRLSLPHDMEGMQNLLMLSGEEETAAFAGMSEALQAYLGGRIPASLLSQINASDGGGIALATGSIFTAGKVFVSGEPAQRTVYLYTFETGYPIAVIFTAGEDGAVSASGMFLFAGKLDTGSAEALQSTLEDAYGIAECTVEALAEE